MADEDQQERRAPHPVKDIVLPLAVVLTLVGNALYVGSWGGRTGERLDSLDRTLASQGQSLDRISGRITEIERRLHDLERDAQEDRKDFELLDDYTRGRIDRLPYHAPQSRRR